MRRSSSATLRNIMTLGAVMSLSVCNEVFGGIYDDPAEVEMEIKKSSFSQINATEYTNWVYIDLSEREATTVGIGEEHKNEISVKWDLATHRYDIKTNEGTVSQTIYTSINDLKANGKLSAKENFAKDEWATDKIAIDMPSMMEGNTRCTEDYRNGILSGWLNVGTSSMSPIYIMSNQIYLTQLKDNTYTAIRFTNHINARGVKDCIDFDFLYPLDFGENN